MPYVAEKKTISVVIYPFGFRGDTLINGAVSTTATRKSATELEAKIESLMLFFTTKVTERTEDEK